MKTKYNIEGFEKMRLNCIFSIAIFTAALLILASDAAAIGVTPGRRTINFEPNGANTVELTILNTEHKEFEAAVYATGELKSYIKLSESSVKFRADEEKKKISYSVKLPDHLGNPGLHSGEIVVREISPESKGEAMVSTMVAVVSQLHVMAPYPGKYAEAQLFASKSGEQVNLFVRVSSLGEEDIKKAKALISILDPSGKEVVKVETDEQPIAAKSRKELKAPLEKGLNPGSYHIIAIVSYDGKETKAENDYMNDKFFIKPLDISVRDFKLGEIARFNILVENTGNKKVDANSKLMFDDNNGKSIADVKSSNISIEPMMKEEMVSYWDTSKVSEGAYAGKIILSYEDKSDERDIRAMVKKDSIKTEIIGITGHVVEAPQAIGKTNSTIAVLVILLIAVNIAWFVYFKKRKKYQEANKK